MVIFPLVVELNLVKCHQKLSCLPWGKCPTLAYVKENKFFKIKDDDDEIWHTMQYNLFSPNVE